MRVEPIIAKNPINTEERAPQKVRAMMSYPWREVPKGCSDPGGWFARDRSPKRGSCEVNTCGKAATNSTNRISSAEITKIGLRIRLCRASPHRERGAVVV